MFALGVNTLGPQRWDLQELSPFCDYKVVSISTKWTICHYIRYCYFKQELAATNQTFGDLLQVIRKIDMHMKVNATQELYERRNQRALHGFRFPNAFSNWNDTTIHM